jgi:hypothetical protein
MNWFLIPSLLLGFIAFALGKKWAECVRSRGVVLLSWCLVLLLALPGFLYDAYYSKLLGEPIWLYELRTWTGSELLAALMGFAVGWIQARTVPKLKLSKVGSRWLVPVLLCFSLALPYLKPVFRPLRTSKLVDQWQDGVCMQSSFSTCGPASAATVLRYFGTNVLERELAEEAFTCASGTENWYLARTLRRHGFKTTFLYDDGFAVLPAIAGVRLKDSDNSGHFIALLQRQGGRLVTGDPMVGRATNTMSELREKYEFTGFSMTVQCKNTSPQ